MNSHSKASKPSDLMNSPKARITRTGWPAASEPGAPRHACANLISLLFLDLASGGISAVPHARREVSFTRIAQQRHDATIVPGPCKIARYMNVRSR